MVGFLGSAVIVGLVCGPPRRETSMSRAGLEAMTLAAPAAIARRTTAAASPTLRAGLLGTHGGSGLRVDRAFEAELLLDPLDPTAAHAQPDGDDEERPEDETQRHERRGRPECVQVG